jgi:hypothetical protein
MADDKLGFSGKLKTNVTHPVRPRNAYGIRVPGGRIMFTRDRGEALMFGRERFGTLLTAKHHWPDGTLEGAYELGSGTVTNVGVSSLANDFQWASPSAAAVNTLKLANYHATGTGATASAATDIALQTAAAPTASTAVAGTQSNASTANTQIYQTVATLSYTSTLAITEWGLFSAAALSATTGTPFTATSATTGTATATPYTASSTTVQGEQGLIVVSGTVYGLIVSNTTSILTNLGWFSTTAGTAGSTPGSTAAFTLQPVMLDHLVFAAINVVNGSTITFTFQLTAASGG